jgi:hypothetical protein
MESTVTISLKTLHCNSESHSGGSSPYLWPAMVAVDKTTLNVGEIGIADSNDRKVLKRGVQAGDTLTIDPSVGGIARIFDGPPSNFVVILTVGMFQNAQTPDDAVTAGYEAYQSTLQSGVQSHLIALNSPDPSVVDQAKKEINDEVTAAVTSAVSDHLTLIEKAEVAAGILTLDSPIASASTSFNLADTMFTLKLENGGDSYEIAGNLTVAPFLCVPERTAVNQATQSVNSAKQIVQGLQKDLQNAPPAQKPELVKEIRAAEQDVATAEKVLDTAKKALQACLKNSQAATGVAVGRA